MADHVLALILAFSRQLRGHFLHQQQEKWRKRSEYPPGELTDSAILVIGVGGAGMETAKRAQALGMRVIAVSRSRKANKEAREYVHEVHSQAALYSLLPQTDWIAVCCPLYVYTFEWR